MRLTAVLLFVLALSRGLENARGDDGVEPRPSGTSATPSDDQLPRSTLKALKGPRKGQLRLSQEAAEQAVNGSVEPGVRTEFPGGGLVRSVKARARLDHDQNQTAVDVVCGNEKCDHHEVCIYKQEPGKHICVRMKPFRSGKRPGHFFAHGPGHARAHGRPRGQGHGQGHIFHASSKFSKKPNDTELERHRRIKKLKVHAREFQEHHDQRFKMSAAADKIVKLNTKKFIDGNGVENNTSDKWNKGCRLREMDGIGRRLLDQFKMSQDEGLDRQKVTNKRRKEKRNSTKKELHDDDECICQAPVSWQFQQLDADTDSHLSQAELENVTTQGVCFSQFVVSCDHDGDRNLSEKEWCCCFADILPPCLALLKTVPTILVRGAPMVLPGAFVPKCDDEGFFSQVQCRAGVCWCVDRNGIRGDDRALSAGNAECDSGQHTSPPPVAQI